MGYRPVRRSEIFSVGRVGAVVSGTLAIAALTASYYSDVGGAVFYIFLSIVVVVVAAAAAATLLFETDELPRTSLFGGFDSRIDEVRREGSAAILKDPIFAIRSAMETDQATIVGSTRLVLELLEDLPSSGIVRLLIVQDDYPIDETDILLRLRHRFDARIGPSLAWRGLFVMVGDDLGFMHVNLPRPRATPSSRAAPWLLLTSSETGSLLAELEYLIASLWRESEPLERFR